MNKSFGTSVITSRAEAERKVNMWARAGMMYTVKLTRREPTVELIGPKKGKTIAKNHIGITTGSLAAALLHMLLHSCIPIAFSHTKYNGVHANPNVMNCIHSSYIVSKFRTYVYACCN